MNRRHFLGAIASSAAIPAVVQTQPVQDLQRPISTTPLVRTPLVLMAPRPDGFDAIWAVNQLCKGKLEWQNSEGETGEISKNEFGFVPQGDEVLRLKVNGLKPGSEYRVRAITTSALDGSQDISPWKKVRTLSPSGNATKFAVWNDTHINNPTIQKLDEVTPAVDFLMWNGDTCNDWTKPELLAPTLLHPGSRDITDGRPLFLTWGNHDVRGPHAFQVPKFIASPDNRPYYAFRSGPVAAICLHTGEDKPDNHPSFKGRVAFEALRAEQAEWLASIIQQPEFKDAPYRIVFCHIPLRWKVEKVPDYDNGGFDHVSLRSREAWHDSLVKWKTQLVISGHTHQSALIEANKTFPYTQITGGGPRPESATLMTAEADGNEFQLEVKGLDKATQFAVKLKPLV